MASPLIHAVRTPVWGSADSFPEMATSNEEVLQRWSTSFFQERQSYQKQNKETAQILAQLEVNCRAQLVASSHQRTNTGAASALRLRVNQHVTCYHEKRLECWRKPFVFVSHHLGDDLQLWPCPRENCDTT